jgi:hypothetical protein
VLGLLVTVMLLPAPKGLSLEELTEPGAGPPARLLDPVPSPLVPWRRPARFVLTGAVSHCPGQVSVPE